MKKLFLIIVLALSSILGYSQWQYVNGLEYLPLDDPLSANGKLFACDMTEIFMSNNNGASWNMFVDFDSLYISNIGVRDTLIYALVYSYSIDSYKIYYSSVNNISWNGYTCNGLGQKNGSRSSNSKFLITDDFFFLGRGDGYVYRSNDNGHNWSNSSNGLITGYSSYCNNTNGIMKLATDGNTVFAGTQCYGVYASNNNGQNWYELNNGIPMSTKTGVDDIAINSSKMFAVTTKGLYTSIDNGSNWIYDSISITSIDIGLYDNYVLTHDFQQLNYSTDNGATWNIIPGDRSLRWIIADSTGFYMEGWGIDGVSRLSIEDTSFSMKSYGLTKDNAVHMFQIDSLYLVSTNSGGLYYSYDAGINWSINENSLLNIIVNSIIEIDSTLVAATNYGIYYSYDNGLEWYTSNNELSLFNVNSIVLHESILYAGTNDGIFKKAVSDTLWYPNNMGMVDSTINYLYQYSDTLYSCTNQGVYYYDVVSNYWVNYDSQLSDNEIYSMLKKGETIAAGGKGFIYYSTNNGNNWATYDIGWGEKINYIMSVDTNIFVASSSGVYVFWDNQETWFNLFPNSNVNYLVSQSDSTLFALTEDGIYKVQLTQGFILKLFDIDTEELINIYPNPTSHYLTVVSDQTKIDEVGILDNTGRILKILTKDFNSINVTDLAPGIYYLRIISGNKVISRKFIKQ